ncbi:MAG: GNAT family N-acetyltransferase [Pirellulales bacterium]|nr:GNAT family N-acetyltransferase [Pirellulales bacterium]
MKLSHSSLPATSVVEFNRLEDLVRLHLTWKRLLGQTRGASFFQSLEWLQTTLKHADSETRLRVIVAYEGDQPLGILPLVIRTEQTRVGKVRVCTYPLADWGSFYGPIGPQPTATLMLGLRHLQETARDWDLLDLRWVHRDGVDYGRTPNAMRSAGLQSSDRVWSEVPLVELQGTWEEYLASRDRQWRRKLPQNERRLRETGGELTFVRYRPESTAAGGGDPRWDLYETCEQLAAASWQGASIDGTTLSHGESREYLRDMHLTAAHVGALDLNLLYVGGRPAAFLYGYHYAGNVFALRVGYDASVAQHGAGKLLMARVIEDSFQRGDHTLDLGPGSLEYKRHWQTRLAESHSYCHFAVTAKAQVLRLKRAAVQWMHGRSIVAAG